LTAINGAVAPSILNKTNLILVKKDKTRLLEQMSPLRERGRGREKKKKKLFTITYKHEANLKLSSKINNPL